MFFQETHPDKNYQSVSNFKHRKAYPVDQRNVEKGIRPTRFGQKTEQGVSNKLIFPGAIVQMGGKEMAVNFLKFNPDFSAEANFNHSAESVEFDLVNAFQKLTRTKKPTCFF
jgi:ABC-2 type transport system permease protein